MCFSLRIKEQHLPAFGNNWRYFLIWGICLMALGVLAIAASSFTTLLSVIFLGFLITLGGIVAMVDAFTFWRDKKMAFFTHLLVALLYLVVGIMLVRNPFSGSVSLTLLLGIFYIFMGVFRIAMSATMQAPRWGWSWFNGVMTLLIGIFIMMSWPESSLFIIGLFVGVDLLFFGWTYVMFAAAAKNMMRK